VSYRELLPHRALRPFVDRLWVSEAVAGPPHRVLPDGCMDLLTPLAAAAPGSIFPIRSLLDGS
jgi:hypothetical protein